MNWLSPAALWVALAALPLIAAYLHQRRKIVRRVPSLVILGALGEHISSHLIEGKRAGWIEYLTLVHPWERDRYLAVC